MSTFQPTITPPAAEKRTRQLGLREFAIALALFVVTTAIFSPAWKNDFVAWDDTTYVVDLPEILQGLSFSGLRWAMTANVCSNWHPITLISLQADAQFFGSGPQGFHRTAVLIHAMNAALAFLAFATITGCCWRSALVAAFFALHPLRVESVAWISERKDVLSGCFFWLTILSYAAYVRVPSVGRYLLVATCYLLGLGSKSMLVTTPCVLLLLDYWPLARLQSFAPREWNRLGRLILEKIPLLGLSAVVSILTMTYQKTAISTFAALPFKSRLENAVRGSVAYLGQTAWPVGLSNLYPIPDSSALLFFASLILLFVLTGIAFWWKKQSPYLLVGWFWFLGMLVPVSGLIQVGTQQRADRYTYLPQVGLFLAIVWGIGEIVQRSRASRTLSAMVTLLCLAGCSVLTIRQIAVWEDTKSLWQNAYRWDSHNRIANFALILEAFEAGDRPEAVQLAKALMTIEDRSNHTYIARLGSTLADYAEYELAAEAFGQAIQVRPDPHFSDAELFLFRGETLAALGLWKEALADFNQSRKLSPNNLPVWIYQALALQHIGRPAESNQINASILKQAPQAPEAASQSAWNLCTDPESTKIQIFRALCLIEEAIILVGEPRAAFLDIQATCYAANGQFDLAVSTADQALQRAENEKQSELAAAIRERRNLFQQHKPFLKSEAPVM